MRRCTEGKFVKVVSMDIGNDGRVIMSERNWQNYSNDASDDELVLLSLYHRRLVGFLLKLLLGLVHATLQLLRGQVGSHFLGVFVAREVGVSAIVDRRNDLFRWLNGWRWRRGHTAEVRIAVVPLDWRSRVGTRAIGELGHTLVWGDVSLKRWRLVATSATHPFGHSLEGHSKILAHTSTTAAVHIRRGSHWTNDWGD